MAEVSPAAEELIEDVEGVAAASAAAAAFFVLFDAVGAVAVVDLAQLGVGEDFVGFADFDEFLRGGFVVGVLVGVELLRQAAVGFFEVAVVGGVVEVEDLEERGPARVRWRDQIRRGGGGSGEDRPCSSPEQQRKRAGSAGRGLRRGSWCSGAFGRLRSIDGWP
jgi:hypothetical protein